MATTPDVASSPSEPRGLNRRMFSVLTLSQLERVSGFGSPRSCDRGDVLFTIGARSQSIFVILRGRAEIVRLARDEEQVLMRLARGQFTGEVGTLAGQNAMVSIRAVAPTDVIGIGRDQLIRVVQTDSDSSLARGRRRNRLRNGAGGGGRTRTRFEPNGILSRRDGARLQGNIAHNWPHVVTMRDRDDTASSPSKQALRVGSSTERAQSAMRSGVGPGHRGSFAFCAGDRDPEA
jgi:cyclic nucleotide-binding protein